MNKCTRSLIKYIFPRIRIDQPDYRHKEKREMKSIKDFDILYT